MLFVGTTKSVERICALIPAYNEEKLIGEVVALAQKYVTDVLVVDDGSPDNTARAAGAAGAIVLRQETNRGKSEALTRGFHYILKQGYDAVVTLDADGMHDPAEITRFLDAYKRKDVPVLVGNRMAEAQRLVFFRRWTIHLMCYWLNRLFGIYVPDPPCGFRFYRCDVLPFLLEEDSTFPSEFETLLHIAERRIRIESVRITKPCHLHKKWISPFRDIIRFVRVVRKYYRGKAKESLLAVLEGNE